MATTYAAKFSIKDVPNAKTRTFTLNGIGATFYGNVTNEDSSAEKALLAFGAAYAAALDSQNTLSKATVVKTEAVEIFKRE